MIIARIKATFLWLYDDVFKGDIAKLRDYCAQEVRKL
jgi:hypothetical protein